MSMGSKNISDNLLRIARCGRVVGLKGEISLWPISNLENRYQENSELFLENGEKLCIEKIRTQKDHYVVKFVGRSTREDVENLTNNILYGQALDQSALEVGEYFVHDCIGKNLLDQDGNNRGKVVNYHPNAASDLLESQHGMLVPFKFITRIDEENVYLQAPEGLFEVEEKDYS